jgi:3-hydroxy-9,10-secoandrosta-1,3,5(10)-triene-9,17-dione monooxygenase reductase component
MGLGVAAVRGTKRRPPGLQTGDVLSHFCSGIAVITGHDGQHPIGFLCQSVAAVSVDPAYVSFRPTGSTTRWPQIRPTGRMCINILAEGQESIRAQFARSSLDTFAEIDWSPAINGTPQLHSTAATIEAELEFEHGTGDDTFVMAYVTATQAHGRRMLRRPRRLQASFAPPAVRLDPAS